MKRKFAVFYTLITSLSLASFIFVIFHGYGYRINRSSSLPFLVYEIQAIAMEEKIERGDCVLINLERFNNEVVERGIERGYVNRREPMLKLIGAVPGDAVTLYINSLRVNNEITEINIAFHDSYGGKLVPWKTPITLGFDEYWLISDPKRGFDSRYFGPVKRETIIGRAYPVF